MKIEHLAPRALKRIIWHLDNKNEQFGTRKFYVVRLALATWSLRECLEHASNVGLLPWILQPDGGRGFPEYSNRPFVK